ncbi:MAG: transporter substrate-binding domain-containing protein [Quinella sp. 3Q1]|nr:transporter substrate-binding domain-containing protein [Quinella sp. 3Q1]MBR6886966.1 transporter substrate-binding domain-containing protein [Selenomonadaceae bacterium]
MRLKKFLAGICAAGLLMTGCGGGSGGNDTKEPDSQGTIIKLGMISHLNASEKQMEEYLFKVQEKSRAKVVNHVPVFYDNLNLMQMGLEAGNVDQISVYNCVANYLLANNNRYEVAKVDWISGLEDNFCLAVRKDDSALKIALDAVIGEMKSDGTLDNLVKKYIIDVDKGESPPAIDIPKFDGAETIKIGVTGDLPPLDYVSADGKAAGFNTAMLAEVAKRLGKNIEIVNIDSGARAVALTSKQIDVIFWAIIPIGESLPADIDTPEGVELSAPYFKDEISHLELKK